MSNYVHWILSQLEEQSDGKLLCQSVYEKYVDDRRTEDESISFQMFSNVVTKLMPNVMKKQISFEMKNNVTTSVFFIGIGWRKIANGSHIISLSEATTLLAAEGFLYDQVSSAFTRVFVDADDPLLQSHLYVIKPKDVGTFDVEVDGNRVSLKNNGLPNELPLTKENLRIVTRYFQVVRLCHGVLKHHKDIKVAKHLIIETKTCEEGIRRQIVRDYRCYRLLPLTSYGNSCRQCQKTYSYVATNKVPEDISKEKEIIANDQEKQLIDILNKIPNLPNNMIQLILSMVRNSIVQPAGRRWDKSAVMFSLHLWLRSPQAYDDIRASGHLVLPSTRLLQLYKNVIHQKPGFNEDVFQWMEKTATQKDVPASAYRGGIVFDEMTIQEDLQLDNKGGQNKFVGEVELGEECADMDLLKCHQKQAVLANHTLQFEFLGFTGFTFPFAHFPTRQIQAYHLFVLFWQAVDNLLNRGFHTDFTMFDGSSSNRSFLKLHFNNNPLDDNMHVDHRFIPNETIVFCMDPKHVVKRLRNNALKSGHGEGFTRHLRWGIFSIEWEHWRAAYKWDCDVNPEMYRVNHKLTTDHINPDMSAKMRNHLAEQTLDKEMLHLMKSYQASLPDGDHLNGTVEFLSHTSKIVSFINDDREVKRVDDTRLQELLVTKTWFQSWADEVNAKTQLSNAQKSQLLMSSETREDVLFCLTALVEICTKQAKNSLSTLPSRLNSDVVENFFCQQRSTKNGANTNPSYLQYSKGVNSIVLSNSSRTSAKKANAGDKCAMPYNFDKPCTVFKAVPQKRRKASDD